jgi:hypothetical protein
MASNLGMSYENWKAAFVAKFGSSGGLQGLESRQEKCHGHEMDIGRSSIGHIPRLPMVTL